MSAATEPDGPILLGGVERANRGSESERLFAHVFGSSQRVLGFGGKLVYRDKDVYLDQFMLCCTGELAPNRVTAFCEQTVARIESAGWERDEPADESLTWKRGVAVLTYLTARKGKDSPGELVHLLLTYRTPDEELLRRVFKYISEHVPGLGGGSTDLVSPGWREVNKPARELSPGDLARLIEGRRVIAYTGAGVSRASGIATFEGEGSLSTDVPLMESFPGVVLERMIGQPARLAAFFGAFQARLLNAHPNAAHHAITHLERLGVLQLVITNNFDKLHEAAGSRFVKRPHNTLNPVPKELTADVLLVAGVSADEHGIVDQLRQRGAQVIAIDPIAPGFLHPVDGFVAGQVEVVLPKVAKSVSAARARKHQPPHWPWNLKAFLAIVDCVCSGASTKANSLHGDRHWRRVAWLGVHLAREVPGSDPTIVLLFALLHDARRLNEGFDPEHGHRAAELARDLNPTHLGLDASRLELLECACYLHADGDISHDPTVGTCWDADRLDLWRCGLRPEPRYLSTSAALDPARIQWSGRRRPAPDWPELYAQYDRARSQGGPNPDA